VWSMASKWYELLSRNSRERRTAFCTAESRHSEQEALYVAYPSDVRYPLLPLHTVREPQVSMGKGEDDQAVAVLRNVARVNGRVAGAKCAGGRW
jgi:hypothetical protein